MKNQLVAQITNELEAQIKHQQAAQIPTWLTMETTPCKYYTNQARPGAAVEWTVRAGPARLDTRELRVWHQTTLQLANPIRGVPGWSRTAKLEHLVQVAVDPQDRCYMLAATDGPKPAPSIHSSTKAAQTVGCVFSCCLIYLIKSPCLRSQTAHRRTTSVNHRNTWLLCAIKTCTIVLDRHPSRNNSAPKKTTCAPLLAFDFPL